MSDEIVIEPAGKSPSSSGPHSILPVYYYEWSARDKIWMKLLQDDPDPPTTLPPGKFDGQVIEVRGHAT